MKYHISTRGEPVKCEAEVRQCPRDHYDTEGEALIAVENEMMGSRADNLRAEQADTLVSIHDVLKGSALKDLDTAELTQTLVAESREAGFDETTIKSAIGFASVLHSQQARGARGRHSATPYIEHPLRNTLRLVRLGVKNQDVVVASLLHDTVEDSSVRYCQKFLGRTVDEPTARRELLAKIEKTYGRETKRIVLAVTNPYLTEEQKAKRTAEEKRKNYAEHVRKSISNDPAVYLVKISDFLDNAGSLHHSDKPGSGIKVSGRAAKYLPVAVIFKQEGKSLDFELSKGARQELFARLDRTGARLKSITEKYS